MVDEDLYEIAAVLDQWYEPAVTYFKVQSTEGKTYLLRYDGLGLVDDDAVPKVAIVIAAELRVRERR
jgi:hypothetical protein